MPAAAAVWRRAPDRCLHQERDRKHEGRRYGRPSLRFLGASPMRGSGWLRKACAMNRIAHIAATTLSRVPRTTPLAAVALCFFLPFFTATSCGSGSETSATGVQLVTGATLHATQTEPGSIG